MNLSKKLKTQLIIAVVASVLFVVSIPLIPVGASARMYWLMIPAIVMVAGGFFGLPIFWVFTTLLIEKKRLYDAITGGMTTVDELCRAFDKKPKEIKITVSEMLRSRILAGYMWNDDKSALIKFEAPIDESSKLVDCPYCGGARPKGGVCPYCGH